VDYFGRVPAPPLDSYVDDVYVLTGTPRHRRVNVPPMPSAHLFLNLGDPVVVHDVDPATPPAVHTDAWFMGVSTRRVIVEYPAQVRLVGVHFKPWGLSPFIDLPSSELRDGFIPADVVWGSQVERLRDRAAESISPAEALQVVEDELRLRLCPSPARGFELVQGTAGLLAETWGTTAVNTLTRRTGVSANHLASQFKRHVGVTPKRMARIYRFARLILSVDAAGPVDWGDLAYNAGYFDQAHLSKEFKDFTGHTPTEYLALRRRLPAKEGFPPDVGPMPVE
jgi:AraC-like DNA-binding protein